jgi:hypothetical protein
MLLHCAGVHWDESGILRWLEPLSSRSGELAEVFGESLRETSLSWRDGEIREHVIRREAGGGPLAVGAGGALRHVPHRRGRGPRTVRAALGGGQAALPIRPPTRRKEPRVGVDR